MSDLPALIDDPRVEEIPVPGGGDECRRRAAAARLSHRVAVADVRELDESFADRDGGDDE